MTRLAAAGALFFGAVAESAAESVALTAYYPSPSGSYTKLIATSDAYLARNTGSVGIGTSSPQAKLHMAGSNQAIRVDYNGTDSYFGSLRAAGIQFGNNGENRIVAGRTNVGGALAFYVNNTNDAADYTVSPNGVLAIYITSTGRVGIGTNDPRSLLDVNDTYKMMMSRLATGCTVTTWPTTCAGANYPTMAAGIFSHWNSAVMANGITYYCCSCPGGTCPTAL